MQAASFNYDMLYKVARAISDEVRAKVTSIVTEAWSHIMLYTSIEQ